MGFKGLRKWEVYLTVMIIIFISFKLEFSEAATLSGRRQLQTQGTSNSTSQLDDVSRVDPLQLLKKYRGGYDITNRHYWSSVMFTGIYGYAIGLVWLVAGAVYFIHLLATDSCKGNKNKRLRKQKPCHKQCFLCVLILTTVFAILAIIGSGAALGGTARFHSEANTIISVVIDTADRASATIHSATGPIKEISETLQQSTDGVGDYGADAASFLASTSDKLEHEAANIERQAQQNRHLVGNGLTILYLLTVTIISLNLVAVIALSVFGILKLQQLFHMLIILCWILTTLCWLLFGAYFFLERFSGDTCTALQNFQQNPENSSLSLILPCEDLLSAKPILSDIGVGIYDIVDQVNANISLLKSNSFPELEYVCNPFSGAPDYLYQPEKCPTDTIQIGDIPQVLKLFTCSDTSGTSCEQGGFITTGEYNVIEAYTTSIQRLLDAYPEMESLVDCQLVKNAFSEILVNHCKPLKRYVKITWISTLLLSIVTTFMVLLWTSTTHHERNHHFADGSIKPNDTEANNVHPEAAIAATIH